MRIEELEMDEVAESMQEIKGLSINSSDEEKDGPNVDDLKECDDDYDDEEQVYINLGFVDKPKYSWSLQRQLFPSKAGGVPAWLDPVNIPSGKSCLCDMCGEPLQFVLQVYAPISEKESTFHRTLYVFMCNSMTCLLRDQHEQWKRGSQEPSRSVKVFRCQLPRTNAFYSSNNPKYDGSDKPLGSGVPLCVWCGTWKGDKVCSRCKSAHYCFDKHQAVHWRTNHKVECPLLSVGVSSQTSNCSSKEMPKVAVKILWREYEITCEDESEFDALASETNEDSNSLIHKQEVDDSIQTLMDSFEGDDDKRSWATFQERLAMAPDQVLRYSRDEGAKPLWPTSSGRPSKGDIPKCDHCGGARKFEFQMLPQLLYYFGVSNDVNSLDWATVVIYTCAGSCDGTPSYKEEFAWVQLVSPNAAP